MFPLTPATSLDRIHQTLKLDHQTTNAHIDRIFNRDKSPNLPAQIALKAILEARVDLNLFAPQQLDRSIVASGGKLNDLILIINYAADTAILRNSAQIEADDLSQAIQHLQDTFERQLGESPVDSIPITYKQKADRLVKIYLHPTEDKTIDSVMLSLLETGAMLGSIDEGFWVHPLVINILVKQGMIQVLRK
jgi:hypothetical protein